MNIMKIHTFIARAVLGCLAAVLTMGVAQAQNPPPTWEVQSNNVTLYPGQTLKLTVLAGGVPRPNYQWQFSWDQVKWTNVVNNAGIGVGGATSTTLYMTNFPHSSYVGITNFRATATNPFGSTTSSVVVVTVLWSFQPQLWTMNFAMVTTNYGPGIVYSNNGVLGLFGNTYWNTLNGYGGQVTNVTAFRDDGMVTNSGITFKSQAGISVSTFSSWMYTPQNSLLLDQFAQIYGPTPFVFSNIPNGRYNLALYGCVGGFGGRAVSFTVLTNGVSAGTQILTNQQDLVFLPNDNTAVFTNLVVRDQRLEVDVNFAPTAAYTNTLSGEGGFNGAQLQLIQYEPYPVINCSNGTCVLTWVGGGLYSATNVSGPWVTNPAVSPFTFAPTEAVRFFRIVNYTNY